MTVDDLAKVACLQLCIQQLQQCSHCHQSHSPDPLTVMDMLTCVIPLCDEGPRIPSILEAIQAGEYEAAITETKRFTR